ncbi:putative bifunctional diguanylate cyclase/phosphodiesterase [Martelella soudanensis]|uniref:putative bifunctional diguanylate cyclase/phosphodiesterase n=1 Tax=unclassified Martelella TaxID=2629616 RepID=UPI0015E04B8A|nr:MULTISPECIES: EAL domain-containing protein [unclassified Martelella]
MLALSCGVTLACAMVLTALFGLWVGEKRRIETNDYIAGLANVSAPTIAAADIEAIGVIAAALVDTSVVKKLEIRNQTGLLDLIVTDGNLSGRQERHLLTHTQTIVFTNPADGTGELTLYFSDPSLLSTWILRGVCLIAIAALGLLMWRAPTVLADSTFKRELLEARNKRRRRLSKLNRFSRYFAASEPKALPEANAFGELFESETEMVVLISVSGQIVDASHGWLSAGGYRRENVLNVHMTEFIADSDRRMIADRLERMRSSSLAQAGTLKYLRADGSRVDIWFSALPVATPDGDHFILAVIREIPEISASAHENAPLLTDPLTGLLNRMGFERALDHLLASPGQDVICVLVDFDRFKTVIDHHGFQKGEEVLRGFVKRLTPALDERSYAARLGGDEFAFVLAGAEAKARAEALANAIHDAIYLPFTVKTASITTNVSIGIASAPDHATDGRNLLRLATIAVSVQKKAGRHGTLWFEPEMFTNTRKRAQTEADLRRGIEENLFEPHFQPIISLASGATIGFEALIRINHPEKGVIMPGEFIAIAEETEQIAPAGRQFFAKALAGFRQISKQLRNDALDLAVNLSPVQLTPDMVDFMAEKLDAFGIDPARLTVEITEAVFLEDSDRIRGSLQKLRLLGCRLALDDFGTGYSSLSYLSRLQVDVIKIDQSFTRNLTDPDAAVASRSRRLIEGIAAISLNMGCQMVAEGVENEEQARQVHAIGAQYGQGYLYSRPLPLADTIIRLSAG